MFQVISAHLLACTVGILGRRTRARISVGHKVAATMLDFQNLRELGKGGFARPFGDTFYSPRSPAAFNIQDGGYSAQFNQNNMPSLEATHLHAHTACSLSQLD